MEDQYYDIEKRTAIYEQWWRSLAILAGIIGVGVILFFSTAFISGNLICFRDRLLGRQKEVAP